MGAVADLARHLDLEVVAEGIEKPETAVLLAELGCAFGQGHHFAQSMSPGSLPLWVRTREPSRQPSTPVGPPRAQAMRAVPDPSRDRVSHLQVARVSHDRPQG